MISDSFFVQGVSHQVCEDYALSGPGYAIVSDGCSNGGGPRMDTDWGARILCKTTELMIDGPNFSYPAALKAIGWKARQIMEHLPNLNKGCLTATLLTLNAIDQKESFKVRIIGDGVVGGKRKDGRWKIHVLDFNGAPYYLKYHIFDEDQLYFDNFGDKYTITTYFGRLMDESLAEETPDHMERWGQVMSVAEKEYTINPGDSHDFSFPMEEYEFAFVCTDGIQSFYKTITAEGSKHNETIFVLDAMRVLFDFVNFRQGFAQLQANWAFRQDKTGTFQRRGWKNSDDVAAGVIYAGT